jgi:surface antigen
VSSIGTVFAGHRDCREYVGGVVTVGVFQHDPQGQADRERDDQGT